MPRGSIGSSRNALSIIYLFLIAFFVSVVSGINLGLAGLIGTNIGMQISSNRAIFVLVGLLYVVAAYHLYQRWNANKQKLF